MRMKRITSFLLALVLIFPTLPVPARAAATDETIQTAVSQELTRILARVNPGEGTYDGAFQLMSHALFGNGEALIMDEEDAFTGMIANSNVFLDGFIPGFTEALRYAHSKNLQTHFVRSYYAWYQDYTFYQFRHFMGEGYPDDLVKEDPRLFTYLGSKAEPNTYDNALIMLVGDASADVKIRRTANDGNSVTYHVGIRIFDQFDFDGNYESHKEDTSLAKVLKWMGKLMAMGAVIHPFRWEVNLDFDVTLPNNCNHQTDTFRWEFQGKEITAVSGNGWEENAAYVQEAESGKPYFRLNQEVKLLHDRPWVLEFRMQGMGLALSPAVSNGALKEKGFFLNSWGNLSGCNHYTFDYEGEDRVGRHQYGISYHKNGIRYQDFHTFRLDNRLQSDGTNMVYLCIDGQELGPMDDYYIQTIRDGAYGVYDEGVNVDWFNGRDMLISYIFNNNYRYTENAVVDYIQIWENGEGNAPVSYITSQTVAPQPGVRGYTQHSCSQCGAVWKDSFTDALEGGIAGSWETDIVLPAADLGVETEDARLRCTLTFGTDGTVRADWKAIDLSAFREFYHTLFVNAYYACAYGAGMTDLAQVEQACQESNGMGVSDYIYAFLDSFDINALFTPAPSSGTYKTEGGSLYTDLNIMGNPSDPSVPNPFTVEGNTLTWTAASYGMPDYTFLCNRK